MKNQFTLNNSRKTNYDSKLNYEFDSIYRHMNILSHSIIEGIKEIKEEINKINNSIDVMEKKLNNINKTKII